MNDFDEDTLTPISLLSLDSGPVYRPGTHSYHELVPVPVLVPAAPSAARIYELIMAAAERQIATADVARPIIDAGVESALHALMAQIAANAANPIADLLEDALADCVRLAALTVPE